MASKKLMTAGSASIDLGQIQAAGDATIDWLESQLGQGWLATTLVDPLLEKVRAQWEVNGVPKVTQILTDLGWTVTANPLVPVVPDSGS